LYFRSEKKIQFKWPLTFTKEKKMTTNKNEKKQQKPKQKPKQKQMVKPQKLADGAPDWNDECVNCGETPTVHPTGLCGPCCFGEADTVGGNW